MNPNRYTIFPSKDKTTGGLKYAFKDEKIHAEEIAKDGKSFGTPLYCINSTFLIIENAADAITVCSLLNHIENKSTK